MQVIYEGVLFGEKVCGLERTRIGQKGSPAEKRLSCSLILGRSSGLWMAPHLDFLLQGSGLLCLVSGDAKRRGA
jgi:hypothetical protein